ncbi:hypothetical protein Q3G72_004860 [Acer saccharum]|nr:hypothetical protein Q3G72_004860 [Acer saccharum]
MQRKSDFRGSSEEYEYSSSGSESEDGPVVNGLWLKGECSKLKPQGSLEVSSPINGICELGPAVLNTNGFSKKEKNRACSKAEGAGGVSGESGPIIKKMSRGIKKGCVEYPTLNQSVDKDMSSIQVVPETQKVNEQGIDLVVDLRRQEREDTVIEASKGSKMVEAGSESDMGELSKTGGNCGSSNREGSETSSIRRVKRRSGKGEGD